MKKKWVFIVIGLLLVVGIGGKVYMDKKEERKEAEKIEAERMSVEALKNTFADIKSIEIEKSGFDKKTGSFDVFVKMTNQKNESVNFGYNFWISEENLGAIIIEDAEVQVDGLTTNKVHVIYSNKEEDEV
ncbi:hypothetical protein FHP05_12125 [Cerasibacillus terrae]|uniref:DUF1433 domain-containing protein n=1 Tax=Cerasibacillus terrae TaxID=2498845 RepID=A0A5C8NN11_9BACI|nr:hypothetical protein [Cerasibacillus terrae]TXL62546.1 hypothetical protein FHP05_12125 [Cerasibacillus terrae]